jgi:hypothetical protein
MQGGMKLKQNVTKEKKHSNIQIITQTNIAVYIHTYIHTYMAFHFINPYEPLGFGYETCPHVLKF